VRYDRSPPKDTTYLKRVWELKQDIRREEGYLCQTWDFFSTSYENNTAHVLLSDGGEETNGEKDNVVGFAVVRGDGYILFLGVDSRHRGEGLGRLLVEKAAEDHDVLTCHARASNENAVAFYEHLGFEVDRYVDSYYQNGEDAIYMSRDESVSLTSKITDALKGED
jgi:ribosomal protein S18 acetylase RimI-like enzyme